MGVGVVCRTVGCGGGMGLEEGFDGEETGLALVPSFSVDVHGGVTTCLGLGCVPGLSSGVTEVGSLRDQIFSWSFVGGFPWGVLRNLGGVVSTLTKRFYRLV